MYYQAANCVQAVYNLRENDISNIVWLVHTHGGEFVGTVLLTPNIPTTDGLFSHEVAVAISPQYWNDRVAAEAILHTIMWYKTCNILRQACFKGKILLRKISQLDPRYCFHATIHMQNNRCLGLQSKLSSALGIETREEHNTVNMYGMPRNRYIFLVENIKSGSLK